MLITTLYKIKGFEALFEKVGDNYYHVYGYSFQEPFERRYIWYRCENDEIINVYTENEFVRKSIYYFALNCRKEE